ncbi:MAG TPA: DUF4401 domain-containing protein [Allosphingosinicella sp.]|nr:DUF4401 domain-containing protein [Allosphingosinicella sp.]
MTAASLWARLAADDLVEGDQPAQDGAASPWFVRVMLGIAGWIGALFLIAFVGAAFAFIMDDARFAALAGAACCAAAFALFRGFDGNDFAEQFGLAVSLVGQILIVIGLAEFLRPEDPALYFAVAAVEAGLALAVPNFLHRVLATSGAAIAVALGVNQLALHGLAAPLLSLGLAFVWLEPKRWAVDGRIWRPIGYGLVLALLLVETFRLFGAEWLLFGRRDQTPSWFSLYGPLLGRGLTAAALIWVATVLALREGAGSRISAFAVGGAILLALLSLTAPGLASALLILLLGFAAGNRILIALGILSLLGFVAHFYYSLHATLLEKSGILALTGVVLLAAHFLLRRLPASAGAAEAGNA